MSHDANDIKLSLAQWSLHRALKTGTLRAVDFPVIARDAFGFDAVEFVSGFYQPSAGDPTLWRNLRQTADAVGVKSLLIMVDEAGELGSLDAVQRRRAVENHFPWVDAASILGCHSIRVNAFGEGPKDKVAAAMVDALQRICAYAAPAGMNVLVENHGLYSSDAAWVVDIIRRVQMPNVGTLPDFGNWCLSQKWGSTESGKDCGETYDRYLGVEILLPYARGVSAKSYAFDTRGNETIIDYGRMLRLVRQCGYTGHIGVEFEGVGMSETEGIRATRTLLEREWQAFATTAPR